MCGNADILLIKMGNPLFTRDSTLGSFHMFDLGDLFFLHILTQAIYVSSQNGTRDLLLVRLICKPLHLINGILN